MNRRTCGSLETFAWVLVCLVFACGPLRAAPQQEQGAEEKSSEGGAEKTEDQRVDELERRIQLLAEELERLEIGEVAEEEIPTGRFGLAPAASKVYGVDKEVAVGGYGKVLFQAFADERDDGEDSGKRNELDFLRAILYFGYKWNGRILFNSELEFEHASTGSAGEVPAGFERNPADDRSLWTLGLGVKPHPSVVFKLDFQNFGDQAGTGVNQWNIGLGYMF